MDADTSFRAPSGPIVVPDFVHGLMPQRPSFERRSPRVLVLGIVPTLTWSVVRCLCLAGLQPIVLGWHELSPLMLAPGCKYLPLRDVRWVNGALEASLLEQVDAVCRAHGIERVIGVDVPSIELLSRHAGKLEAASACAVPSADSLATFNDKWLFSQRLGRLALPQPRTELARGPDDLHATELVFPVITKPTDRWAGIGFRLHATRASLLEHARVAEYPLLVQEFAPGVDVGFAFLARHGRLVAHAAFTQPRRGVRRYFDAPTLERHAAALLADSGYHGVGQIDTRYDPSSQRYRVLELNPRFWASLLYAAHADMNFPALLVRLDELREPIGFRGREHAVRLSPYELLMNRTVLATERARNGYEAWRARRAVVAGTVAGDRVTE
jgi:predicted ATP-grasp superfamily ATP-dependent carboligase